MGRAAEQEAVIIWKREQIHLGTRAGMLAEMLICGRAALRQPPQALLAIMPVETCTCCPSGLLLRDGEQILLSRGLHEIDLLRSDSAPYPPARCACTSSRSLVCCGCIVATCGSCLKRYFVGGCMRVQVRFWCRTRPGDAWLDRGPHDAHLMNVPPGRLPVTESWG